MDWKTLRIQAGLTLEQLSERTGYGVSTINGLEKKGEGSQRLKDRLAHVLKMSGHSSLSVKPTASDSVTAPVAIHEHPTDYQTDDASMLILEIERLKKDLAIIERLARRLASSNADRAGTGLLQSGKKNVAGKPPGVVHSKETASGEAGGAQGG